MSIDVVKLALDAAGQAMKEAIAYIEKLKAENAALRTAIAEAEKQEPVCEYCGGDRYTTPPAAQRQPLTDEEIDELWREATLKPALTSEFVRVFARAIEAAHGIGG
jgi:hypothetical protein